MENLEITPEGITWEISVGSNIKYKSLIMSTGDNLTVFKNMFIDGKQKLQDITHIPLELLPKIIEWVENKQLKTKVCEHPWSSVVGDGEMQPAKCLACGEHL